MIIYFFLTSYTDFLTKHKFNIFTHTTVYYTYFNMSILMSVISESDLNELKKLELALKDSEKQYHNLFENMIDGYAYCKLLFDKKGRPIDWIYLEVNKAFEQLTGLKNIKGKKVSEAIPEIKKLEPELFETYGRVTLTGIPESFRLYFKPLKIWLHISVYRPETGHFITLFENITKHKEAEIELIESKNRS